ncbi:50S ribosomal protein L3 [Candidatus Woesearchaeota archaeon]|nr:50S ribosomal protein L3 [Candidatus Woesearchaeota archaeon]
MPTIRQPKKGTWQFWHRARARRPHARIRTYRDSADTKPLGFAGYKAGMGHAIVMDNRPNSPNFKTKISIPFTIIECPPLRVAGIALYSKDGYGLHKAGQINAEKLDKELGRKVTLPKKKGDPLLNHPTTITNIADVKLIVHTQPKLINLKKTPELFELGIGGKTPSDKLAAAQRFLGKDITIKDVFAEGHQIDVHAITKGHGIQGPVKRFGVSLRSHKSEKTKRGPGNVGPWAGNRSWTVSHAGQMGYHQRFQHNSLVLRIGEKGADITPAGGLAHYGVVSQNYLLVKGSVGCPTKRLIKLTPSIRPNKHWPKDAPTIEQVVI